MLAKPSMAREPEGKLKRVAFGQIQTSEGRQLFLTGPFERHLFEKVGHNPPQEAPETIPRAVLVRQEIEISSML